MFTSDRQVLNSLDFQRIDNLPRRTWTESEGAELAAELTRWLRTPNGTMALKPVQAIALREAWQTGGLFGVIGVGSGKTLLSLLLPRVMQSRNSVLLVAAGLDNEGRRREVSDYMAHWDITPAPQVVHYDALSVVSGKNTLEQMSPDLLIIDECHLLKNPHASRTRRVHRFLKDHPNCRVCVFTGTVMKRSLRDYQHIARWVLGARSFLPLQEQALEDWADALDERLDMGSRAEPGILLTWSTSDERRMYGDLNAARRGYQRRMAETPGVVVYSLDDTYLTARVRIGEMVLNANEAVSEAYRTLRTMWVMPDGTELVDALEFNRHARTLALGYWLKWRDPAPEPWRNARKAWFSFVHTTLTHSRSFDSPLEVERAYPNQGELQAWRAIKPSYRPVTVPVWLDAVPLDRCAQWLGAGGVAFTDNTAFGEVLAQRAGVPYFGAGGLSDAKMPIDTYAGPACVASLPSNHKGRNLQRWSRMLITASPQNGLQMQQLLGRMQRMGQTSDTIDVTVLTGCTEHRRAFWQCMSDCEAIWHTTSNRQILLDAEVSVDRSEIARTGWEWG